MTTARTKKMIVLGIDGMDAKTTHRMVEEGKLPHIKKISGGRVIPLWLRNAWGTPNHHPAMLDHVSDRRLPWYPWDHRLLASITR
ncbi:hypothetical protein [Secundilactobacillus collinoides]|uniref:hypothetical protein n=1 Tax=Secundilactobacillus collinoides TaxID=33960 RepID=UPI000AAE1776|nr:hypothetical protein [Secundilactobacillus collinoides]